MKLILVAEDEQLTRWSVSEFLRSEHFEVTEAPDGKTAIELIEQQHFDAVISDYSMPGRITGLDVLRHYRERWPEKLAVLITGHDADTKTEVEALGGIYLRKPIFLEELLGILSSRANEYDHGSRSYPPDEQT